MSRKPTYWCQRCCLALMSDEVTETQVSEPYEFWGTRGVDHKVELRCGECGDDVEDYVGQDEVYSDE